VSPIDEARSRFADALRAEHAAIYGYGVIGAKLDATTVALASQAEMAHRVRRDALVLRLTALGLTPPPAEPVYAMPAPVTDQRTALGLSVTIEERTAAVWRAAMPSTVGEDRTLALDALTDCAVRATKARKAAGVTPLTVAFPGRA
jgi:hypothetical protein